MSYLQMIRVLLDNNFTGLDTTILINYLALVLRQLMNSVTIQVIEFLISQR